MPSEPGLGAALGAARGAARALRWTPLNTAGVGVTDTVLLGGGEETGVGAMKVLCSRNVDD